MDRTDVDNGSTCRDRISELPDDVITRILSYLPIKDVVKTTLLSRRWRNPWIHILNNEVLDVQFHGKTDERRLVSFRGCVDRLAEKYQSGVHPAKGFNLVSFCGFMDRLAEKYQSSVHPLKRFNLHLNDHTGDHIGQGASAIDSWIRKLSVEVQNLSLHLFPYTLPGFMFDLPRLQSLHISGCALPNPFPRNVRWPCLKELSIAFADVAALAEGSPVESILGDILSGSPALYRLKLEKCRMSRVEVSDSSGLRELVIESPCKLDRRRPLEIIAPSLLVLRLRGRWPWLGSSSLLKATNVSSLVEAELDFFFSRSMDVDEIRCSSPPRFLLTNLENILDKLQHVTTLHIGDRCLEMLANMKARVRNEFAKWEHLIIKSKHGGVNPLGIIHLLDRSPHLNKIDLTGLRLDELNTWKSKRGNIAAHSERDTVAQCLATKLKYVKTVVLRWSDDAAMEQAQMVTYDLEKKKEGKEQETVLLSVAQQISSYWRLYYKPSKPTSRYQLFRDLEEYGRPIELGR